jgi:hypothetical protein
MVAATDQEPGAIAPTYPAFTIWYAALERRDAYNIFYSGTRPDGCRLALTALRRRRRLQQSIKVLVQSCQLVFALTNLESGLERDVVAADWPAFA